MSRPPVPPFDEASAIKKVQAAEDAWNSRDPAKVKMAYTEDSKWRNRDLFLNGRDEIEQFLIAKWKKEKEYRLIKELWTYNGDKIAVRFCYEWYNESEEQWYRAYGNENWHFDENGPMKTRIASINDLKINESDRLFKWTQGPRPQDHKGLSALGL